MFLRGKVSAAIAVISILTVSCSGRSLGQTSTPDERVDLAVSTLASGKTNYYKLTQKGDSGPGVFYVIDTRGVVLWHKLPVLIGSDFSKYDFVKQIIEMKNGCIAHRGGVEIMYVFFREMHNGNLLCLSVNRSNYPALTFNCRQQ